MFFLGLEISGGCLGSEMRCFFLLECLVVVLTYSLLVAPFFLFKKILFFIYNLCMCLHVGMCIWIQFPWEAIKGGGRELRD